MNNPKRRKKPMAGKEAKPTKSRGKSSREGKEKRHIEGNKIDIKRSLMGDLKDDSQDKRERQNNLQRRLDETDKGRISISPKTEEMGDGAKSKVRGKKGYTTKQEEIIKEEYEKDYVWIRRELEGYAPLYKLDIWNKIKTSLRLIDEKSGKSAMREAEKVRAANMKAIKIESEIKRKVTEYTKDILEAGVQKMEIEITISPDHMTSLEKVLSQDYFGMFKLKLVDINPNLKRYGINPPILLVVERR